MSTLNKQLYSVVIGGIHHNTLGVVRSLGEKHISIKLIVIDPALKKRNFITVSKYVKNKDVLIVNSSLSALDKLLEIKKDGIKRTIVCCSDDSAELIANHYHTLKDFYYCPHAGKTSNLAFSKKFQFSIASSLKISVPNFCLFNKNDSVDWNKFPCITKPERNGLDLKTHKSDIFVCNNIAELKDAICKIESEYFFIQEMIDKKIEFQLIGCSMNDGKEIVIPGYTKIIRQPHNTNTGYLYYSHLLQELNFNISKAKAFLSELKYNGLFSLEFIRGIDGIDYFLEINLRNDGNAYCVTKSGINLPYIWCYYQFFNKLPAISFNKAKSLYFMPEFSDFKLGIKTVGLFKWLWQFFMSKAHSVFNIKDPKPFIFKFFSSLFRF